MAQKPFADFLLFKSVDTDEKLRTTFSEMQRIYVFNDADIIPFSEVIAQMRKLNDDLLKLDKDSAKKL